MKAGRDFDRWIAEHIMGDQQEEDSWRWLSRDGSTIVCDDGGPKYYSTQIAHAFEVAEALHALIPLDRMTYFCYLTLTKTGGTTGWAASFDFNLDEEWFEAPEGYPFGARGATAAEAICRAAQRVAEYDGPRPPDVPHIPLYDPPPPPEAPDVAP